MAAHSASVTVNAPVSQVYQLWTHFNDFPKFMTFVKEVTYKDDVTSHWAVDIIGHHEWDAVNENWVKDRMIGWRSTDGLENSGVVSFEQQSPNQTRVNATINYNPPAGFLGDVVESLGAGSRFEKALQHDLDHFAKMVDQAPPGALDPESSSYLFHEDSATARGETTDSQDATFMRIHYQDSDPQLVSSAPPSINQAFPSDTPDPLSREDNQPLADDIENKAAP